MLPFFFYRYPNSNPSFSAHLIATANPRNSCSNSYAAFSPSSSSSSSPSCPTMPGSIGREVNFRGWSSRCLKRPDSKKLLVCLSLYSRGNSVTTNKAAQELNSQIQQWKLMCSKLYIVHKEHCSTAALQHCR